jgi:acetoin utilization protein AcuB
MSVERYMTKNLITIPEDASIQTAISVMKEHSVRHLPVVKDGVFVGLVTQSDLRGVVIPSLYGEISIKDVMISNPIVVHPDDSIEMAASLIYQHKIGSLPVVKNNSLVGILTISDILAAFIEMMGVLKQSTRLDLMLRDAPESFEEVSRIIKENGGKVISVGMLERDDEATIYSFRLQKGKNLDSVVRHLEQAGHRVVSIFN